MQRLFPVIAGLYAFLLAVQAAGAPGLLPLTAERTIALPNVSGRIDHLAYDGVRKRLMVAELGNNTVDIVDLSAGTVLHRITGLKEPQGIAYLPGPNLIVTANAEGGEVRFFDGTSFLRAAPSDSAMTPIMSV